MKTIILACACICTSLFLSACSSVPASQREAEQTGQDYICRGQQWHLMEWQENGEEKDRPADSDMYFACTGEGQISGVAFINRFFGQMQIDGDTVKFSENFGSTMMAGEPKLMELERDFLATFPQASRVKMEEGRLSFSTETSRFVFIEPR